MRRLPLLAGPREDSIRLTLRRIRGRVTRAGYAQGLRRVAGPFGPVVLAAVLVTSPSAAVPTPQQISVDAFTNSDGQHATAVEPDSFSFGNSVVAVFQLGRFVRGGAAGIGFATSHDGGRTWTSGVLPLPPSLDLASDPTIAYDRVHGVWIASVLGGRVIPGDPPAITSSLLASRSGDGVAWTTSVMDPNPGHDKNWISCDNGVSSPRAGRCYVVWTGPAGGAAALVLSTSDDGGRAWSAPVGFGQIPAFGVIPLVRPDGTLVVVYATGEGSSARIEAVRSTDGGRSFSAPARVALLRTHQVQGLRVPAFHSAEIAQDGRIVVAWQDCRYRKGCGANDIVYASSTDAQQWTTPLRVPTGRALSGLDHVTPGLAVDSTTAGGRTALALAFYALSPGGCAGPDCRYEPFFVSSPDNGRSWSTAERLGGAAPADWFPLAGGRFAGDYISTSFVESGVAVPVFAWATGPFDGRFHQGVYATAVPRLGAQPAVRLGTPHVRIATRLEVRASATPIAGARIACRAAVGRRSLKLLSARLARGTAICVWRLTSRGRVTGSIVLAAPEGRASHMFTARVPKALRRA